MQVRVMSVVPSHSPNLVTTAVAGIRHWRTNLTRTLDLTHLQSSTFGQLNFSLPLCIQVRSSFISSLALESTIGPLRIPQLAVERVKCHRNVATSARRGTRAHIRTLCEESQGPIRLYTCMPLLDRLRGVVPVHAPPHRSVQAQARNAQRRRLHC